MAVEEEVPSLLPPPGGKIDDIHDLIDAMYDMVKSIMVFEVTDDVVKMADFSIKRFLTILVDCDKKINPGGKVPFWIASYTYPCLLNLPEHMKRYGPLKNLWEGSARGERGLSDFKPLHASVGMRTGWAVQITKRVLQKKALRAIGTTIENSADLDEEYESDDDTGAFYSHARESYWKYPNTDVVYLDHYDYKPLCLVFDGENYGAMVRDGTVVKFVRDQEIESVTIRGMVFQSWKLDFDPDSISTSGKVYLHGFIVVHSCVLLPLHKKMARKSLYAAIRDDYTMMDDSGTFI